MENKTTSLHTQIERHSAKRRGGIVSYNHHYRQQHQYTHNTPIDDQNTMSNASASSATTTQATTGARRHKRRMAICSGISSGNRDIKEDGLTVRKFVDRNSLHRLRIHLEPTQMDIVFDQNGKTVGNHEGNLQFHRLCSSYVDDHKSNTTRLHRSLVYIEMLDELKALGVQFYTIRASYSSSSPPLPPSPSSVLNKESESEIYRISCSHCKQYFSMDDGSAIRRIKYAFLARLHSIRQLPCNACK